MDAFIVKKLNKNLEGIIEIEGSKNTALPIIAASLLSKGKITLTNVPKLKDIENMIELLKSLGSKITFENNILKIDNSKVDSFYADYDLVRKMRASFIVLGPLLARFNEAKVSLPGGCAIGQRPVDIHLEALKNLGVNITVENGYVNAHTNNNKELIGKAIELSFPSVGATENVMIAAALAKGTTIIKNAAREPDIEELGKFLIELGVEIKGLGTSEITIKGINIDQVKSEMEFKIAGDRIVAGTYVLAGLITNSNLIINNFDTAHLKSFFNVLENMGAKFEYTQDSVKIFSLNQNEKYQTANITTLPYPGFPTDLQAQFMIFLTQVDGISRITETIFENRFMHVPEYNRLGANIEVEGNTALIKGPSKLTGAQVMCTDLRASAGLVLAGLVAEGETKIKRVYHLDRGYEELEKKLNLVGAKIQRVLE